MIVTWIVGCITFGIYALWIIYTSYRDENEFNNQMEYYILKRTNELRKQSNEQRKELIEG